MKHKKPTQPSPEDKKAQINFAMISTLLIVVMLAGLHLHLAWNRYQQMAESEALQLARSVESLLHVEHIAALASDEQTIADYRLAEQSLVRLVEATDSIYYAYILKYQNEDTVVVVDSSAAYAGAFSPLDHSCVEAAEINRLPFATGRSVLAGPVSAPCGRWVRALTPIHDSKGDVVAVLGLSYSADEWQANLWERMISHFIIVACLLLLVFVLFILLHKHSKLKRTAKKLAIQEALYRNIFEHAPIGIILQGSREQLAGTEYISVNPMAEAILGMSIDDLKHTDWRDRTHKEDLEAELPQFERFAKGEISSYSMEKRLIKPDGSLVWVNFKAAGFSGSSL